MNTKTKLLSIAVVLMFVGTTVFVVNERTDETEATSAIMHQPYIGNLYIDFEGEKPITWTEPNDPELTGISYDDETNTLKMDNAIFIISADHHRMYYDNPCVFGIYSEPDLNIEISGHNTIVFSGATEYDCTMIYTYSDHSVTIYGNDSSKDILRLEYNGVDIKKSSECALCSIETRCLFINDSAIEISYRNTKCPDKIPLDYYGLYVYSHSVFSNAKLNIFFEDAPNTNYDNYFDAFYIGNDYDSKFTDSSIKIYVGKANGNYDSYGMYISGRGHDLLFDHTSIDIAVKNSGDDVKGYALIKGGYFPLESFTNVKSIQGATSFDGKFTKITDKDASEFDYCRILVQVENATTQNITIGLWIIIAIICALAMARQAIKK